MKFTLLSLLAASLLFACGTPASDKQETNAQGNAMGKDVEMPAPHSDGDGHDHATQSHDEKEGHSHDDNHAHETTVVHNHSEGIRIEPLRLLFRHWAHHFLAWPRW